MLVIKCLVGSRVAFSFASYNGQIWRCSVLWNLCLKLGSLRVFSWVFFLFINDICEWTLAKFLLFADDMKLSVKYAPHDE